MAFIKLGNPLQDLLIRIFGEDDKDYVSISMNWNNIVGKYLADYSYVFNIEKNVLYIAVADGVVMQEMCLMRDSIKKRIYRLLKLRLRDIVFFIKDDVNRN